MLLQTKNKIVRGKSEMIYFNILAQGVPSIFKNKLPNIIRKWELQNILIICWQVYWPHKWTVNIVNLWQGMALNLMDNNLELKFPQNIAKYWYVFTYLLIVRQA